MAFVHVIEGRLDSERAQEADAAHSQQQFLHDASRTVAAVHMQCQIPVQRFVFGPVRIQQVDRAAPDVDFPGLEVHLGEIDFHLAYQPFSGFRRGPVREAAGRDSAA